jgi:hypothetical protein
MSAAFNSSFFVERERKPFSLRTPSSESQLSAADQVENPCTLSGCLIECSLDNQQHAYRWCWRASHCRAAGETTRLYALTYRSDTTMINTKLLLLLLVLAAGSPLEGHADAHQAAAATLFQQQQQQQKHTRQLMQPAGGAQQFGYVSRNELLDQAVAELLATATQRQPRPPPPAAVSSDSVAAAADVQVRRCGTDEGSSSDRALAEQRFQARLQQLGYGKEVLADAASNVTSGNTTVTEVPVSV